MKRFILSLLLVLCITIGYAQTTRLRATNLSIAVLDNNGNFIKWGASISVNILIVFDEASSRLIIYSKETQIFDELGTASPFVETYNPNDITVALLDNDGVRCKAQFTIQDGAVGKIYFKYSNLQYVYTVKSIE